MDNNTETPNSAIDTFYNDVFLKYLPVAVFFGVASVVGIVGNIIVVKFYGLKSQPKASFTYLVRCLAYADLIVCILLLIGAIEIGFNISFNFKYLCKVAYFLYQWSIYTSIWILAVISVDRYRKVCRPFKRQMSVRFARNSIPVILLFTLIISTRNVFIYDIVSLNVTVISANDGTDITTGYHCASTTDPDIQMYVYIFHWFDVVTCSSLFLIYLIVYGLITHKLVQHRKSLKAWHQYGAHKMCANKYLHRETTDDIIEEPTKRERLESPVHSDDFESSNNKDGMNKNNASDTADNRKGTQTGIAAFCFCIRNSGENIMDAGTYKPSTSEEYTNTSEDNTELKHDKVSDTPKSDESVDKVNVNDTSDCFERNGMDNSGGSDKQTKVIRRSEYQITVMMLWVTIVFLLSLSSFFFASLIFRQDPLSELAIKPFTHFMIKCVFLNSVSNPVIYFIYNCKFRAYAKTLLSCRCPGQ